MGDLGIGRGGVRTPALEAPVEKLVGEPYRHSAPFCILLGRTDRLIAEGSLLAENRERSSPTPARSASAGEAPVPRRGWLNRWAAGSRPQRRSSGRKAEPRPCDRPSEEDYRDGSGVFDTEDKWRRWT